jgi:NADH-quinone oxidoreductase subunit F
MGNHRQILLANIKQPDQHTLAGYESRGGYSAIRKALKMEPAAVTQEVVTSNLRGRGGAGFPAGKKWTFIPKGNTKPVYVIQNADESEPGTFKDRLLLERDPHAAIEGMMICAWAVQSHHAFIYVRGEYAYPYSRMLAAVNECYAKGYLGDNIFGTGYSLHIVVHRGAGAYICGEETGLINSLEGFKGQPRLKPPFFPAAIGLYGCPTIVNNTQTFAVIPWILNNGGAEYAKIGIPTSTGTALISVSGHINKPGIYEIELGYPMLKFIEDECGGIKGGRKLKAVIPGGSSMPVLTAEEVAKANIDFESLRALGSAMGSGGMIVMDETTDMVQVAQNIAHFYAHESCGQCTPCREGGHWIEKIFARVAGGKGVAGDIELVKSVASQIEGHTICAFGEALSWPAQAFIKKFPEEFKRRISDAARGVSQSYPPLNFESNGAH